MGEEFQILVKEFIVNVWEVRKQKLYGDDSCPNQLQSHPQLGVGVHARPLGLRGKGMLSSGKVSCIVFIMHVEYLSLHVMCSLVPRLSPLRIFMRVQ